MAKNMYLFRGTKDESYANFKDRLFLIAHQLLESTNPKALKIVLTESCPPFLSIIPFKRKKVAVVSVYDEDALLKKEMKSIPGLNAQFEVTEALPVAYTKDWEDGEPTPGICLLTLFNKKKSINYDTFIHRWHKGHTPLSLKLHPLWNYNRNVVEKKEEANMEGWDGIVEEHMRTRSDLLNPFKFFGGPLKIIPNMILVYRDTKSFLDYGSMETYLAMEYHLKSESE